MTAETSNKPKLLCRLIGHRWKASHRKERYDDGRTSWVYVDDVCLRCYCTKWGMPHARGE